MLRPQFRDERTQVGEFLAKRKHFFLLRRKMDRNLLLHNLLDLGLPGFQIDVAGLQSAINPHT